MSDDILTHVRALRAYARSLCGAAGDAEAGQGHADECTPPRFFAGDLRATGKAQSAAILTGTDLAAGVLLFSS